MPDPLPLTAEECERLKKWCEQQPHERALPRALATIDAQRAEIVNLRALIHDLTQPSRVVEELRQRVAELDLAAELAAWDRASNESLNRVDPPASREGDR